MTRKAKIGWIALIMLLAVAIIWVSSGESVSSSTTSKNGKKVVQKSYSDWDEFYQLSSKQPNGLFQWNAILKLHLQKNKSINSVDYLYSIDTIPSSSQPTFMFVGEHFVLHKEELDTLLSRVDSGAQLFISANQIDGAVLQHFFTGLEIGYIYDTIIEVSNRQKKFEFIGKHQGLTFPLKWRGFKNFQTKDSVELESLSGYDFLLNSGKITYGKGNVYLNLTPILFSNHQILSKDGFGYSQIWLNKIPKNQSVYWLEMGRYIPSTNSDDFTNEEVDYSYMQYIFQHKNRVIALVLLTIGIILFLLFRAKRMQPLVPIIGKKRNMTLIFADTITSIYFNQRNPQTLVSIQKSNFQSIIFKHFKIDLSKEITPAIIESLAQKSSVSEEEIYAILEKLKANKITDTSESDLADLRKSILNFYFHSGIISSKIQEKLNQKKHLSYRNEWISGLYILFGLFLFTYGLFLLTKAIAIGILFWPLGAIPLTLGIARLLKPYLMWSNHELIVQPLFGKNNVYLIDDLVKIDQHKNKVEMQFQNKRLQINYWELNQSDAKQFQRFVQNHNKMN